jgi:hypothetical protein
MPRPDDRRRRIALSPWSDITVQSQWTVGGVRAALDEHEQGNCYSSGQLIDALGRDARLGTGKAGILGTRCNALLGAPFRLKPADEDNELAVRVAEEMTPHWWTILSEATIRELLVSYWLGGAGPGQLRWGQRELALGKTRRKRWIPICESWQLLTIRHEEQSQNQQLQRRVLADTQQGEVEIRTGAGSWIFLHDGPRWWLNGSVRSIGIPWIGVQLTARDWWRHSERLGHPLLKAMYPAQADDEWVDGWLADLESLATETTATLPRGLANGAEQGDFDLDLLEAAQESPESFERLLQHVYVNWAIHLLGHNLSAEVREGQAVTSDAADVRADYKRADNEALSTQLRRDLTIPLTDEWYGNGEELAPWPWWEVEPPEDAQAKAQTQLTAAEALKKLQDTGHEPRDIAAWAEPYDLDLVKVEKPTPPPVVLPPGSTEGDDAEEAPGDDDDGSPLPDGEADADDERIADPDAIDEELTELLGAMKQDDFGKGMAYVDTLVSSGVRHARAAVAPDIAAVLRAVNGAETPEEAREAVIGAFGGMDPEKLASWLERAIILAELKGQETVLGEL